MKKLLLISSLLFTSQIFACDFEQVKFNAEFAGGRLSHCAQLSENHYILDFQPENRPINNSGWYAFKVSSEQRESLTLNLTFDGNAPRYLPKISADGQHWQKIPFKADQKGFEIQVEAGKEPLWVAGQEIIDNSFYQQWTKDLHNGGTKLVELGKSTQDRPIQALVSLAESGNEWVLMIGRQHPPEVTGALAMIPFVENVLSDNEQAKTFRQRFNLLIVPNMNPDGVEHGHWRHNVNGVDLNRDWKHFKQAETRLVRDFLQGLTNKGHKLVFALDFHSTQEDVFYTVPPEAGIAPANLVVDWLEDVKQLSKTFFTVRGKPGNSPGRGVFKQYIADNFKVHGVTYEMGDSTDRNLIKHMAGVTSNTLMKKLLATDTKDFYLTDNQ